MTPFLFDQQAPPRGAEAFVVGDRLELQWPERVNEVRLVVTGAFGVLGVVIGVVLLPFTPRAIGLTTLIVAGLTSGLLFGGVLALTVLGRVRRSLTVSPTHVTVRLHGLPLWPSRSVARAEIRDVLVIQEQVSTDEDGVAVMAWRLVSPLVAGGRTILVRRLLKPEFGHWIEACYAEWRRLGR
ncbi:MAG: hypothetical protein SFW67_27730 [Myxococcaceae bacterium]|nr:hypothetical protein [Myxococcaceae bacterium]